MPYVTKSKLPAGVGRAESRLISEYLALKFPGMRVALSHPLGPEITTGSNGLSARQRLQVSRPWRPEVDAIVWFPTSILLIEAKITEYLRGLGKLPLYKALVPVTPELAAWRDLDVRIRLVVPRSRPWLQPMIDAVGAEVDLFEPEWMREVYDYRDQYWTAEYRRRRQEILDARARAGVE